MSEWQPIGTAPKNGEYILATDARTTDWTLVVSWSPHGDHAKFVWDTHDGPAYQDGVFTHWMPLPAPPSDEVK